MATLRGNPSDARRSPSPMNVADDELSDREGPPPVVAVCSFCNVAFGRDDHPVDLHSMQLHETCMPLVLIANSTQERCIFCGERKKSAGSERSCCECNRSICEACSKPGDRCLVCCWDSSGFSTESASVSPLVALQRHVARSKNDLAFEKGDDLELLGKTDFGFSVGRTLEPNVAIGLFPPSAASVVKKYSLRGIRKTC